MRRCIKARRVRVSKLMADDLWGMNVAAWEEVMGGWNPALSRKITGIFLNDKAGALNELSRVCDVEFELACEYGTPEMEIIDPS